MERTYESALALVYRAAGPVESQLGSFVTSLIDQQYTASVVYIKALRSLAFDRWLAKRRIALAELREPHIERYQNRSRRQHRRIRTEARQLERRDVTHLLDFLRTQGVCPAAHVEATAAEALADRFAQHLRDQQGLATATIERYRTVARQFLQDRFGRGAVDLYTLRATDPKAIAAEHAQRAIDGCDIGTRVGLRDRAVLLLLARLGLRAHEIIALRLNDCDWDGGHLLVRGKGGREQLLPMPADVGTAIAAYLQHGRPPQHGSAPVLAIHGADSWPDAGLGWDRLDRAPCIAAGPGRLTTSRLPSVSTLCLAPDYIYKKVGSVVFPREFGLERCRVLLDDAT